MKLKLYILLFFIFNLNFASAQSSTSNNHKVTPIEKSLDIQVKIFPNPAVDFIQLSSNVEINKIEVYNLIGKRIKLMNNINNTFNVSDLRNGIYLIRIFNNQNKIIKVLRLGINNQMP